MTVDIWPRVFLGGKRHCGSTPGLESLVVLNHRSNHSHQGHASCSLAPSPRVLAYLARRLKPQSMALAVVEPMELPQEAPEIFEPPPEVVTTPCDPWPRPYYLEEGLRKVNPYHYTYNTYCKQRWRGREILDIFATEFRDRPLDYYVHSIAFFHNRSVANAL